MVQGFSNWKFPTVVRAYQPSFFSHIPFLISCANTISQRSRKSTAGHSVCQVYYCETSDDHTHEFSSVQSLDRLVRREDMGDDSAEILFQSFLQEALVSSSGMGRDVHSLMLIKGEIENRSDFHVNYMTMYSVKGQLSFKTTSGFFCLVFFLCVCVLCVCLLLLLLLFWFLVCYVSCPCVCCCCCCRCCEYKNAVVNYVFILTQDYPPFAVYILPFF